MNLRNRALVAAAAGLLTLTGSGCGLSPGSAGPATPGTAPNRSPSSGPAPAVEWPTYLGDAARSGVLGGPKAAAQGTSQRPRYDWSSDRLDGDVYASPIEIGRAHV